MVSVSVATIVRSELAFGVLAALISVAAIDARAEPLKLATLSHPDEIVTWGDRMTVTRPFGPWTLRCELSVAQNRRLCSLEQAIEGEGGAAVWRLAQTEDGRQVLIISLPGNMAPATGMKLKFDNFETTVGNWTCSKACIAVSLLDGRMQALMLASQMAEMTYEARSGRTVHLTASMAGFEVALQAAAEDPFGKRLKVMTAKPPIPTPRPPTTEEQRLQHHAKSASGSREK